MYTNDSDERSFTKALTVALPMLLVTALGALALIFELGQHM